MENKHSVVIKLSDLQELEQTILSDIDRTDSPYYYGMLEVLRWIKDKNTETKIFEDEKNNRNDTASRNNHY